MLDRATKLGQQKARQGLTIYYIVTAREVTEELIEKLISEKCIADIPVLSSLQAAYDYIERH